MLDLLFPPVALVVGFALGWWLKPFPPHIRKRWRTALAIVFGAPVGLFVVAVAQDSETLAWVAGLSLMVLLAIALPVGLGFLIGRALSRRARPPTRDSSVGTQAEVAPTRDAGATGEARNQQPSAARQRLHAVWTRQPGVLLAAAGVLAGIWLMLTLGFVINEQQIPAEVSAGVVPAVAALVALACFQLFRVWTRRKERLAAMAKRRAWLTAAAADPLRKSYAAKIEAGDFYWTPERVEYHLDPQATACCEHLAGVEHAMRMAGVRVALNVGNTVSADCCIDMEALTRQFSLQPCVAYEVLYSRDRSGDDPPHAMLVCSACESRIWLVHRREAVAGTPVFPVGMPSA